MSVLKQLNCLKVFCLLAFMLFFQFAKTQQNFEELGKFLEKSKDVLGKDYAIAIVKDGKNIFLKNAGEEFTVNTPVPVANATKWLTTAMIMILVDEGKIKLDDKVSQYLPIFGKYMKNYITIRHCLTHQTGLEQHQYKPTGHKVFSSLEEEVNQFASKSEIENSPGDFFIYGSAGLSIAARVCEVVTKKDFKQLMSAKLFKQLQMRNTNYGEGEKSPNPSGGAISTVQDYNAFLTMLLNKGMYKGKLVMKPETIAEMHKLQVEEEKIKYIPEEANGVGKQIGYGVWLLDVNAKGEAITIASPGFYGNWPFIDLCRGYSCVLLSKRLAVEKQKNFLTQLKSIIDENLPTTCN